MSERPFGPSTDALAAFEAFVRTVTGSFARARHARRVAGERVVRWRREGLWSERDDRALLFRALCERPALIDVDGRATGARRYRLPRRLAELPIGLRLPWALRECATWTPGEIAWLLERPLRTVRDALAEAETSLARPLASDVLVVGRDPLVLHGLARALAEAGHTVVGTAATRTSAVVLARDTPPALVVADLEGLSFGDGNEAVQALRTRLDVPFVLLTSASEQAPSDGVSATCRVLEKPYDPDELRRTCLRALLFEGALEPPATARSTSPATP